MKSSLVVTSLGVHVVAVAGLFVAGFWKLDRLEPGRRPLDLAVTSQPEAAGAGSPAAAKAEPFKKKHPRTVPKVLVQPNRIDRDEKPSTNTSTDGQGTGGTGSGAGSGSGSDPSGTGTCTSPRCGDAKPAPPPVQRPVSVPPNVIKGMRISGETQIMPSATVKTAILRDGGQRVVAVFRVCVGQRGEIASIDVQKASGYPAYDAALVAGLEGWRYRPYEVDHKAVAVCGMVTFIYSIQ